MLDVVEVEIDVDVDSLELVVEESDVAVAVEDCVPDDIDDEAIEDMVLDTWLDIVWEPFVLEAALAVEAELVRVVIVVVDVAPHRKVTPLPSKNIPNSDDESAESRVQAC